MDNINTCTGLPVEESIRMTEDTNKRRKYIDGVANRRTEMAKEQNRTNTVNYCLTGLLLKTYTRLGLSSIKNLLG